MNRNQIYALDLESDSKMVMLLIFDAMPLVYACMDEIRLAMALQRLRDHGLVELRTNGVGEVWSIRGRRLPLRDRLGDRSFERAEIARRVLDYLNAQAGKSFKPVHANLALIESLLKDYSEQDMRDVIDAKVAQWMNDEKMSEYLRPATLFSARNFASYAGEFKPLGEKNEVSELQKGG